ncbi:uncharacterized protein LOC8084018 [Sorghum bicolor]|nr:uncharacterized protein LOC8084018 [Sorghum bicolor]|eukprot:XP_002468012.2 uncharacterized protein LOC8084018 [Sorghum bicolor]
MAAAQAAPWWLDPAPPRPVLPSLPLSLPRCLGPVAGVAVAPAPPPSLHSPSPPADPLLSYIDKDDLELSWTDWGLLGLDLVAGHTVRLLACRQWGSVPFAFVQGPTAEGTTQFGHRDGVDLGNLVGDSVLLECRCAPPISRASPTMAPCGVVVIGSSPRQDGCLPVRASLRRGRVQVWLRAVWRRPARLGILVGARLPPPRTTHSPDLHRVLVSTHFRCRVRSSTVSQSHSLERSGARIGSESLRARRSRQELATPRGRQGAASPRPHETAELDAAEASAFVAGESAEQRNRFLVLWLYEALNARDARRAQELLAPDLEWWFHGPPTRQHMMRLLTGADQRDKSRGGGGVGFVFSPRSVDAFGSTVIAEGADDARQLYWVHAWTVGPDGVITQLREYFNTDLTVTLLSGAAASAKKADIAGAPRKQQDAASSSFSSPSAAAGPKCLWQSRRGDSAHKSLPGLVLAI